MVTFLHSEYTVYLSFLMKGPKKFRSFGENFGQIIWRYGSLRFSIVLFAQGAAEVHRGSGG